MPSAACSGVPAAGISPVDMAVEPSGVGSRSITRAWAPLSAAASAAVRPQAPAPTTTTSERTFELRGVAADARASRGPAAHRVRGKSVAR